MNNRERLIELITRHNLERRQIADLIKVKGETVHRWLLPNEARGHEEVPEMAIELLELKLAIQAQAASAEKQK